MILYKYNKLLSEYKSIELKCPIKREKIYSFICDSVGNKVNILLMQSKLNIKQADVIRSNIDNISDKIDFLIENKNNKDFLDFLLLNLTDNTQGNFIILDKINE